MQCKAIILFEYDELTLKAIAEITDAEVGPIKAPLNRARDSEKKIAARVVLQSRKEMSGPNLIRLILCCANGKHRSRPQLDRLVAAAYQTSFPEVKRAPVLWRFLNARVSIPVPVLLAATIVIALLVRYRTSSSSSSLSGLLEAGGVLTHVSASGFEPLLNGKARIISVKETPQ